MDPYTAQPTQQAGNAPYHRPRIDRALIEELFTVGLISSPARHAALDDLYPANQWGIWAGRLLLCFGSALLLAGIMFFFAFNWARIPVFVKFGALECAIIAGIFMALRCPRQMAHMAVLASTILVGILLAVFGQVYQTGADSWRLFMIWAVLTVPWVVATPFAGLWYIWIIITNIFLMTFWQQQWPADHDVEMVLLSVLAIWNLIFLVMREYVARRGADWVQHVWTRLGLVIPVVGLLVIPSILFINRPYSSDTGTIIGALLSALVHIALYWIYRHKIPDKRVIATIFISVCLMIETGLYKILSVFLGQNGFGLSLVMGVLTLGVFTVAALGLRTIYQQMEAKHD